MRLLICTQTVDERDPLLGFFHRWIEALATRYEAVTVICLFEGTHALPSNVTVYSLGKEKGSVSRLRYALRFWRLIRRLKNSYDAVFVHMNEEYVLLGGRFWKRRGKRIYLWRNHYRGTALTDRAARYCDKIFCTSKYSYTAKYPRTIFMPVGVDLERFMPLADTARDPRGILFLGRMAPSKKPDVLLQALALLKKEGVHCSAALYGSPLTKDEGYYANLKALAHELGIEDIATFHPGLPNSETPRLYNSHSIFVNCSSSGMFDKTLFEAMACECLVVAASDDLRELVGQQYIYKDGDAADLAAHLKSLLVLPVLERQGLGVQMRHLSEGHSLKALVERLSEEMV